MSNNTVKNKKTNCSDIIYFDNNSTTLVCSPAKKIHTDWLDCYNPSSDSKFAKPAKQLFEKVYNSILSHCSVSSLTHSVIFTSGGTESNCFIIRACFKSYKKKLISRGSELTPHIIISSLEHHSIMACIKDLEESKDIIVSYIKPTIYGNILPEDVEKEIKGNTCLISIMYANNEIPVINNIKEIGEIAHKYRIPLHSDCVQIFGKYKIDIKKNNIDALSASGHKFYSPKGVGLLILNNKLIEGYELSAEINGTQQSGLRGGTENIAGIASMYAALKWAFIDRNKKNTKLYALRERLLDKLGKLYKFRDYTEYLNDEFIDNTDDNDKKENKKENIELVSLGPPVTKKGFILVNTVLLAICKNKGKPFCNIELKKYLDSKNIVISIGSACHTNSEKASHVLTAIGAPAVVKRGVIRISFGDYNNNSEIDKFITIFKQGIDKQCTDL